MSAAENPFRIPTTNDPKWVEVKALQGIPSKIAPGVEFPAAFLGYISDLIHESPNADEIFVEGINLDPPGPAIVILEESAFLRNRVYVDFAKLKSVWVDAAIALAVALLTGGSGAAPLMVGVISGLRRIELLSEDEAEVVHVLLGYPDQNPYIRPVPRERLQESYTDATVDLDQLLAKLAQRGVIEISDLGVRLNK
jgi:hypothetical protein